MYKQAIFIRTDLKMGKGKLCSQAAHASLDAYLETVKKRPDWVAMWLAEGQKKIVLKVESEQALKQLYEEVRKIIPASLIIDTGKTQLEKGTITALGIGPAPEPELDRFISRYKLL